MTWDATDHIDLIDQPLLLIAGSDADTKYMSDEAFERLPEQKIKRCILFQERSISKLILSRNM